MTLPLESDPEVLEHLYRRFDYLKGHPLRLRSLPDTTCLGVISVADQLILLLADTDDGLPYRPDFDFLTRGENAALAGYCQVRPALPWPQPVIGLHAAGDGSLRTGEVREVEVLMQPCGSAQFWWGGGLGVVFEAFVGRSAREGSEQAVMNALWGWCEAFLSERGVTTVWTHVRDPEFDDAWYQGFLAGRGYRLERRGAVGKALR